ncbi:MAG TPA: HD domain-containing phosphohydrolase [Desulfosalsimonadaceae bacterium]|nr:HD domain-containing phosphohydrolase [Desulfosalsimonadaceae bacterium]
MPQDSMESSEQSVYVLIVDDEPPIREMMELLFTRAGYQCLTADNGETALEVLKQTPIDVAITDINMPGINGVDLLKQARQISQADFIVITGYVEDFSYETLIAEGASDFIYKPISNKEILLRFKRVLRERLLLQERERINRELENSNLQLSKYAEDLNSALRNLKTTHDELQSAYLDTINRLARAAEYKDEDTGDHIMRMSQFCAFIAEHYGLDDRQIQNIRYASPMHDIGKIGIPDRILLKPDRLTREEFETIKTHTTIGASILTSSRAEVLQTAHDIALTHHEKWDGSGYPRGLKQKEIPIAGRIVAIMDVFDALTSNRPYKRPYPVEIARDIIKKERGISFDPDIVDIFLDQLDNLVAIKGGIPTGVSLDSSSFQWSARDKSDGTDRFINLDNYFTEE